jgi:hypothetical protein
MVDLNEGVKKSVEDIFKNAFTQKKGAEMANIDRKSASDVFKDIFAPKTPTKEAAPIEEKENLVEEIERRLQEKEKKETEKTAAANPSDTFGDLFAQTDVAPKTPHAEASPAPIKQAAAAAPSEQKSPAAGTFKDIFATKDAKPEVRKSDAPPPAPQTPQAAAQTGAAPNAAPQPESSKTSTADMFKNVFAPQDTLTVTPKTPAPKTPPSVEDASPTADKTKVPLADVMKEAKDNGSIDKETYDQAIQRIVKSNIEGNTLVGGFKVVQRGAKSEIVLDEGSIEIPAGSKVEVIKRGGEISIIVKKGEGGVTFEGDIESFDKLTDDGSKEDQNKKTGATKTNLGHDQSWLEGYEDDGGSVTSELKDELDLTDLRKEFRQKKKKENAEAEEAKAEEGEEEAEPSLFDRLFKRIKKTAEENPQEKLKRLTLENLGRVKGVEDERKAIVGVAYVLKEFLEVKYEIPHELTYTDLIRELRARQMNNDTRNKLITFFKNTTLMVYANAPKADSFQKAYGMAERAIKELS